MNQRGTYAQAQTDAAISRWLMSSLDTPSVARRDWEVGRPAVLRTGGLFDAVKMPMELVHAAVESTQPDIVSGVLAQVLNGPVICHPDAQYYALVPPQTTETWRSPLAAVLGRSGWLTVPRVDRTRPPGIHWTVPIERAGKLCAPSTVVQLLRIGRARCEGVAPVFTEYTAWLTHTQRCATCTSGADRCPDGAELWQTYLLAREDTP
ncbi:hypothetical protein [Streptomyces sp. NPDC058280]|uniref:hypothetical protein n=1 Tax=Streptomyces sp. NPDC058280 TaxID=3346419 RepID=UPI0036EB0AAC